VGSASEQGELITLKYLVEEAKAPLDNVDFVSAARFTEHYECENYLLEKGAAEPTDQEYEDFVRRVASQERRRNQT
jgi:biotin synthase-related radical SAM superfamily protein